MLKPKLNMGAIKLLVLLLHGQFVEFHLVSAKVENSFQNSQYSQYKDFYSSTANYAYPDLTKSSDINSNPIPGDSSDSLLSQASAQQPVQSGAANQHVYYYETYPMQDSSRGNAYGAPGSNKRCTYMGNGNMRCYSRQDSYGVGSNDYDTTGGDSDASGSGLGGLAGLIGLLGLKGIKGLASVVSPILFPLMFPLIFPILLPVLLPLLLPLLLLLLLPILLIPIPVISIPTPGVRSLELGVSEARKFASSAFERVISSDECVERISCEISRMSKGRKAGEWMEKALGFLPERNSLTKRIYKGFNAVSNSTVSDSDGRSDNKSCISLKCKMLNIFDGPTG